VNFNLITIIAHKYDRLSPFINFLRGEMVCKLGVNYIALDALKQFGSEESSRGIIYESSGLPGGKKPGRPD
jgi:hypothetical protein